MKSLSGFLVLVLFSLNTAATPKDSTIQFYIPDTLKAVSFISTLTIGEVSDRQLLSAGIKTGEVSVFMEAAKKERQFIFSFPGSAKLIITGHGVDSTKMGKLVWAYPWMANKNYRLLLAAAADSAANFTLYSGYVWLPDENKWKLVGTCKIERQREALKDPAAFIRSAKNNASQVMLTEPWVQRNNGTWKSLADSGQLPPVVNLLTHIDSLKQFEQEKRLIEKEIADNRPFFKNNVEGVYYQIIDPGTGRQVTADDTVTVFYRLTLLNDTAVIDATKDKPATFPLKRLIRGWQLGVPLLKPGGKIKLLIPSAHAYSIRTRSPRIPPNSILEFEVEVVAAKPPSTH